MKIIISLLVSSFLLLQSCMNTNFDTARMLQKGNTEIGGSFSHYIASNHGESEDDGNNIGLRVGYGFTDKFNMRLTYDKFLPPGNNTGGESYSALSMTPKFSLVQNKLALTLPVGLGFYSNDEGQSESRWVISPALLYTSTAQNNKFDFTGSFRAIKYFQTKIDNDEGIESDLLLGFNIGAGFSNDLNVWAVRPEFGLLINPSESGTVWTLGIGFQYIFGYKALGE